MPRLHDLALKARFTGANVNLLTNGTRLGPSDVEIMDQIGVGCVQIPILAAEPVLHDYTTGLSGSWQRAVDSALRVSAKRADWLLPVLIVSKLNAHCVEDILRFYNSRFGVTRAMVNRFNIGGLGLHNALELNLSTAEFPEELRAPAASLFPSDSTAVTPRLMGSLAGEITRRLLELATPTKESDLPDGMWGSACLEIYRRRLLYVDEVVVCARGSETFEGVVRGVDSDYALLVETDTGVTPLSSGEISIRPAKKT